MKKRFMLEKLPIDCGQRKVLYRTMSRVFESRYGKTEGPIALKHAKRVAEEVARYTANSMDKHWAGMCVALAVLHPLDMNTELPHSILAPHSKNTPLSQEDRDLLERSFISLNILRAQDEAPVGAKNSRIYNTLLQPYKSRNGFVVLPPEAFVRTIDMSERQFFAGKTAKELHKMTLNILCFTCQTESFRRLYATWPIACISTGGLPQYSYCFSPAMTSSQTSSPVIFILTYSGK